jgi:hypothetical protein
MHVNKLFFAIVDCAPQLRPHHLAVLDKPVWHAFNCVRMAAQFVGKVADTHLAKLDGIRECIKTFNDSSVGH